MANLEKYPFGTCSLPQQVDSPNRNCQGLSCGIQFFLVSLGVWNGILHSQLLKEWFNRQVRPTKTLCCEPIPCLWALYCFFTYFDMMSNMICWTVLTCSSIVLTILCWWLQAATSHHLGSSSAVDLTGWKGSDVAGSLEKWHIHAESWFW